MPAAFTLTCFLCQLPPAEDIYRFPGPGIAKECRQHVRMWRDWAEGMRYARIRWNPEESAYWIAMVDRLQKVDRAWHDLQYAHEHPDPVTRRLMLRKLRDESLGPESYYLGRMPAAAPEELLRLLKY